MELVDYLRLLRRRWLYLALGMLAGLGGAALVARAATPSYVAEQRLFVASATGGDVSGLMSTLSQVAASGPVQQQVLQQSPGRGSIGISTGWDGGSSVLTVQVTGSDPQRVTSAAQAYAAVLPQAYATFDRYDKVSLKSLEQTPATQLPLHRTRTLAIGLALGLLVGLGAGLLREALDSTVRDPDELARRLGHEVLAVIPADRARGVVTLLEPNSPRAESYRRLRAALRLRTSSRPVRTLLVTSATVAEGKTSTVLNLAAAAAQAGERVVVVDADLRRPAIAGSTGAGEAPGLTDVLLNHCALDEAVQAWGPLSLLTAGTRVPNPVEVLGSRAMRVLLEQLASEYDLVLVDSPAVLPIADAEVLAADCDAVLFVTRLKSTSSGRSSKALQTIERIGREVVGVVANFAADTEPVPRARRRRELPSPTLLPNGPGSAAPAPDDLLDQRYLERELLASTGVPAERSPRARHEAARGRQEDAVDEPEAPPAARRVR